MKTTRALSPLFTLDVAHPPQPPSVVEQHLLDAWNTVRNSSTLRVVKIVHGYGSTGRGGSTRETVRNWAFAKRRLFRAVITGEQYTLFNTDVQEMRMAVGQYEDPDLRQANPGITVIWVK
jgi:NADH:ubiquinone oxidoreductase subunit F (NADH-binding)